MTGRELIIYILENNLENEEMFSGDTVNLPGLLTLKEAAVKMNTGISTVRTLYMLGKIKGCRIGGKIYIYDKKESNV